MRRARALLVLTLLVGCGVPSEDGPRSIPDVQLPGGPSQPAAAPDDPGSGAPAYLVYFVVGDELTPTVRHAPTAVSALHAVEALLAGPNAPERDRGLRSAIPRTTILRALYELDGTLVVDLSSDFAHLTGREQLLAVAQVVVSLFETGEPARVAIALEGEPVSIPRQDGTLAADATAADYATFVGPPAADPPPTD